MVPIRSSIKSPAMPTPANDLWLRIIGIPLAVLPFVYYYIVVYGFSWPMVFMTFCWGMVSTTVAWQLLRWWVFWVRSQYTQKAHTRRRILLTFGGYFFFIMLIQPIETWGISQIDLTGLISTPDFPKVYLIHIAMALSFVVIVGGYYEISYYLQLYRIAITEAEHIKKLRLQRQLEGLKNQVNPHFLFNSLNSLSALIYEDRQKANAFLDELATVYRYLLQVHQTPLIHINNEIDFIRSYGYLLQIRYGSALEWSLQIENGFDGYLPPLTLQTLVDNAIRYNVIEIRQPLQIVINATGNILTVANMIQRKACFEKTSAGGLANLTARYNALDLPALQITESAGLFNVCVKLSLQNTDSGVPSVT